MAYDISTTYGETGIWYRYDKKFAYLPTRSVNNEWLWLCEYYKKYIVFSYREKEIGDISYLQCKLSAEDAVVDKLKAA
jgi:hypothetical protein